MKINKYIQRLVDADRLERISNKLKKSLIYEDVIWSVRATIDPGNYLSVNIRVKGGEASVPVEVAREFAEHILKLIEGVEDTTDAYKVVNEHLRPGFKDK